LFRNALSVSIIAVLIIFQPELRRALESLGRRNFLNTIFAEDDREKFEGSESVINEIVEAVYEMSEVKTGALIVIEQHERLDEYEGTGISIGAYVSRQMLVNIFEHNTPLHDGAVIIRDRRIVAATCYLPLSDNMTLSKELGTRHRAGVGISEVSDAVVIIVSEENGKVSVAIGGNLVRGVESEYLKNKLLHIYSTTVDEPRKFKLWRGRTKVDKKNNK
jgi:diadenylate cyclase